MKNKRKKNGRKTGNGQGESSAAKVVLIIVGVLILLGGIAGIVEMFVINAALPGLLNNAGYITPAAAVIAGIALIIASRRV